MSVLYYCNWCKSLIEKVSNLRTIQVVFPASNKKMIYHACPLCYEKFIEPPASDIPVKPAASSEDTSLNNCTRNYQKWDEPRLSRESKYFSNEICFSVHRLIIAGAKPIDLSKRFKIGYQVIRNYVNNFEVTDVPFVPTVPISELEKVLNEYGNRLIKIKTLLATCTWSLKDIAGDTAIDLDVVNLVWNNLPWFVANFKVVEDSKVDLDGEDFNN